RARPLEVQRVRGGDPVRADRAPDALQRLSATPSPQSGGGGAGPPRGDCRGTGGLTMQTVPWWEGVLPVFDVETTGSDPREARIVSAALLLCLPDGRVQPGGVDVIVNPGVPIPDEATAVHGITTERARAEGIEPAEAV